LIFFDLRGTMQISYDFTFSKSFSLKTWAIFVCLLLPCLNTIAQDRIQAEKIKFEISNELIHPLLQNKEKKKTEIDLVIPTSQPSNKNWAVRAWETDHPIELAIDLLEIGISYQINTFIMNGGEYLNANKTQIEKIQSICKDFNVQLILKSALFSLPLKKDELDELEDISKVKNVNLLISIDRNLSLSPDQTTEYLSKLLESIKNKNIRIYCDAFSRDENFQKTIQQLGDSRVIPIFNWTKRIWSLTAATHPLIATYEGMSLVRMNVSLENFGENEILAMLQDYIGFRQTECSEIAKNLQGFSMNFGNKMTSFGSLNAVNIYTMSEFLLNRSKDLDIINNNWFTAQYGHKDGLEIMNITSSSAVILRQALYANNNGDIEFTNNLIPNSLLSLLTAGSLQSWAKIKNLKTIKSCALYKEKLNAKETIVVLEKNYKHFIANKKFTDSILTLDQIAKTKEIVEMIYDFTALFIQAQLEPINTADLDILNRHIKKYPTFENIKKELQSIYIDKKPEFLEKIPQENLPAYLQKQQ